MSRSHAFSRALAAALALALAGVAQAQLSTATVKGQITSGTGAAPAGMAVVAVNKDSGFSYRTTTKAGGAYVITSLPPGEYEIRITGPDGTTKTDTITLAVGETASLNLAYGATKVEEFVVTAPQRKGVKTSEVGTTVSLRMIEALPQATANFLSSADLAPGVAFVTDQNSGFSKVQAGAQSQDNVNVFIDGVSQKNQILKGGVTGQDSSRGNPFPQSAIAQYKVISSNYKAEFDQVSSAAITAVTKSGTNELHGDVYYDYMGTALRSKTPFEYEKDLKGQKLLSSGKHEFGLSLGGAIKEDVLHYLIAYDGKNINDSRQVVPKNLDRFTGTPGIVADLAGRGGTYVDPFQEHLAFARIDAQYANDKKLWGTVKYRFESDRVPESRDLSAHGNDKNRSNNELRFDLFHEWNLGTDLLATTRAGYQNAVWNPKSASSTPLVKYRADLGAGSTVDNAPEIIWVGGSPDDQKRGQSGFTLAQEATFTGLLNHVLKGGARANFMSYDLSGTSRSVDIINTLVDQAGVPYYNGSVCTGTSVADNKCRIDPAIARASVNTKNTQIGLFVQDDWNVLPNLELNLGVRWDYETNMLNNAYVTPADRVAALNGPDLRTIDGISAVTPHTYAESLAMGGININDYIADGKSRKAYPYAFAPRLGVSYDIFGDKSTVLFGGYGRSYDRFHANNTLDELQKNQAAGGEIWLIRNEFKMPYSDQFSAGVRQGIGIWNAELSVAQIYAQNQFAWFAGMRDPQGGFGRRPPFDPVWGGGPAGYGNVVLGDFVGKNRTFQVMAKLEKQYAKASPWTASVAYTYADAQTMNNDWTNSEPWDWTYGRSDRAWHPSTAIDKHRLVAAAMSENLLPFGVVAAGKVTYGSGLVRRGVGCLGGWPGGVCTNPALKAINDSPAFTQVDLAVSKSVKAGLGSVTFKAEVFNVFNTTNYLLDNPWLGGGPGSNPFGGDAMDWNTPRNMRGPMRSLKLTGSYSF